MFLLCNGLLVFVGITRSLSGSSGVDEDSKYGEDGLQSQYSEVESNEKTIEDHHEQNNEAQEEIEIKYSAEKVEGKIENMILEDEEEGGSGRLSEWKEEDRPDDEIEQFEIKGEEEEKVSEIIIDEFQVGENVAEEEENSVMSTEELNKKFDEFIKRMKEDLRIEARRRLVVV